MKTNLRFFALAGAIVLAMMAYSCQKAIDATENAKVIINYDLIETIIDIQLVDAHTGKLIGQEGDKTVTISITGPDHEGVVDITGYQPSDMTFQSHHGFVALGLVPDAAYKPTADDPVVFNITARTSGYIKTSQTVTLISTGRSMLKIDMVSTTNPPQGVDIAEENNVVQLVNGTVQNSVQVNTPDGKAQLEIPEGLVMYDAGGTPLSGSISVSVAHFDNTVEEAMTAFPGGMITGVSFQDGSAGDGMFFSAGLLAIEITDDNGRNATTFENGSLLVTAAVGDQTYNPETGSTVADGDEIPVWSYNENTGQWTEEGMATIVGNRSGFEVSTEVSHLSYYNFDWFVGNVCYQAATFIFTANVPICDCFTLSGVMRRQVDNSFVQNVYMWVCDGEPVYTAYAPQGIPVFIEWNEYAYSGVQVSAAHQPTFIPDLCTNVPIEIDLVTTGATDVLEIEVEVYCAANPNVIIRPSFSVWYCLSGTYNWQLASMTNGEATICDIQIGADYDVGIYYQNNWYQTTVTVDQSSYQLIDFELPADVCSEVFGY